MRLRDAVLACSAVACGGSDGGRGGVWDSAESSASHSASGIPTSDGGDEDDDESDSLGDESGEDDSGDAPNLDVGGGHDPDTPSGGCGCDLTYIWVANSSEGTVSKIDVRTLEEEGRYVTRPDGDGDPSRTSVNLAADVAVANRYGGLVKIFADPEDCRESNGMPGIQTSTGPDFLPWGVEECVAWYREFPTSNQRPVAWTPGEVVEGTCDSKNEKVWTVHSSVLGIGPGIGGFGGVTVHLLDGDSGATVQEVQVDDFSGAQLGAYGGAVDGDGHLYFSPMGGVSLAKLLARVDIDTFDVTLWEFPGNVAPYGITVDHTGKVWVSSTIGAGAARFDPETETWDVINGFSSLGGLAEGQDNLIWVADNDGMISIDIETFAYGPRYLGPSKGVSVDLDGYVWSVDGSAIKVDPKTGLEVGSYNGLNGPYTYSDMTGHALGNVTCPPPEG